MRLCRSPAGPLLVISGWRGEVRQAFTSLRHLGQMMLNRILISGHWLVFIWAVNAGYIVEYNLRYYINLVVNELLGFAT
jgi:chloramphenicol-sensitive protein RarD